MSKQDWSKAPEDAQFYSCSKFRKHESDNEFCWEWKRWLLTPFDRIERHEQRIDFEMRPEREVIMYTGQMSADQLHNTKIRIESEEHRKAFLEMVDSVFGGGYKNASDKIFDLKPFYFINGVGMVSHQFNDFDYFNNHQHQEIKWQPAVSDEPTLEEDEAFAELEAKSNTKAEAERWNGEGFPPSGIICKFNNGFGEAYECQTIGMYDDRMVCMLIGRSGSAPERIRFGTSSMFYPKPLQKEVWCKEVLSTLQLDDKTTPEDVVGMMYQRFQQGDIKPPEEEA